MYKLINFTTKEEHICSKVSIDGFDYYVTLDKFKVDSNLQYYYEENNSVPVYHFEQAILPEYYLQKVIATNNPNIDLPQIINEANTLSLLEIGLYIDCKNEWEYGYNKSQESHPFTKNDMIEFAKWLRIEDTEKNAEKYCNFSDLDMLQYWQENEQIKTIYYK